MADRLAEIEALLDAVTPGPWEDASTDNGPFDYEVHTVAEDSWSLVGLMPSPHDARLIATAVNALPDLLAVAKAARKHIAQGHGHFASRADLRAALTNLGWGSE